MLSTKSCVPCLHFLTSMHMRAYTTNIQHTSIHNRKKNIDTVEHTCRYKIQIETSLQQQLCLITLGGIRYADQLRQLG